MQDKDGQLTQQASFWARLSLDGWAVSDRLSVSTGGWIPAPPIPGTFVLNVADILQRFGRCRVFFSHFLRVLSRIFFAGFSRLLLLPRRSHAIFLSIFLSFDCSPSLSSFERTAGPGGVSSQRHTASETSLATPTDTHSPTSSTRQSTRSSRPCLAGAQYLTQQVRVIQLQLPPPRFIHEALAGLLELDLASTVDLHEVGLG